MQPRGEGPRRQSKLDGRLTPSRYDYREERGPQGPAQQGFRARGAQPLSEPPSMPRHLEEGEAQGGEASAEQAPTDPNDGGYFSSLRVIGQFKRQYIVCEDATSLVVIDQHAAHERIGYERLKKIFETEHKETQPLLFPKRIELDAVRAEVLQERLEFFEKVGFEVEHFGQQTYVLKSVPAIFQRANIDRIVREAIDDLSYHGRSSRMDEAMDAILSRMACHSVVRGPTTLTEEECYGLFEQMDAIDFAANCPHGRPVYWRMGLEALEAAFDRR